MCAHLMAAVVLGRKNWFSGKPWQYLRRQALEFLNGLLVEQAMGLGNAHIHTIFLIFISNPPGGNSDFNHRKEWSKWKNS